MRLALDEAKKGQGRTAPNPCVGAVVVNNGVVVGRGYHHRAGTPHAEVHALADAGSLAEGATIYVTLEPCNHQGRTPPCTRALSEAGIARVVVGMEDPNPGVQGKGNEYLRSVGIQVDCGILEQECVALNRPFIKHSTTGIPWVALKAGMSLDGKISYREGHGGAITGTESGLQTHRLRNQLDAILIGAGTARVDNPSLTTRLPEGERARDPVRVVLDTRLSLDPGCRLLQQESSALTMIYCAPDAPVDREEELRRAGAEVIRTPCNPDGTLRLSRVLAHLGGADITSILVEGGAAVHASFLSEGLVDEFYFFIAPLLIGHRGTPLIRTGAESGSILPPEFSLEITDTTMLGPDCLLHGFVRH